MPLPRLLRPPAFLGACTVAASFSALSAQVRPAAEPVIELPEFTVTETPVLPDREAWSYARITDFEVLSSASDRETRRILRDFEIFRQALAVAWREPQPQAPGALILCGRGNRFPQFLPPGETSTERGTASLFLKSREQAVIVVNLDKTINLSDPDLAATGGAVIPVFEVDAYKQLYREYVHYMLSQGETRPPAWLAEGVAQIIMDLDFSDRWVTLGQLPPATAADVNPGPVFEDAGGDEAGDPGFATASVTDQPFHLALARRALLPMEQLFAVTHDAPEARNPLGSNRWAKQSYAFVHLCLFGENGKWQKPFAQFVNRVGRGEDAAGIFEECFGVSTRKMLEIIRGYISFTRYKYQRYVLAKGDRFTAPPPVLQPATEAQIGRIKGDALRLAGRRDAAHLSYRVAYVRGERDPQLLAALGVEEIIAGRPDRGQQLLTAATQAGVDRPSHYVELARLRFARATSAPAGAGGRLSAEQVAGIINLLTEAVRRRPPLPETYALAALTWLAAEETPRPEQLKALDAGIAHFPRFGTLVLNALELNLRAGVREGATRLAAHAATLPLDEAGRARLDFLRAEMTAAAPATPAADSAR